jgi:hypothetical protein
MTGSQACRGRIGIAFSALGFSSATEEGREQAGDAAAGTDSVPAGVVDAGFLVEPEASLNSLKIPLQRIVEVEAVPTLHTALHANFRSIALHLVELLHSDTSEKMGDCK